MIYASNILQAGNKEKFTLFSLCYTIIAKHIYTAFTRGFDNNLKTITE